MSSKKGQLEQSCDYLSWAYLFQAVLTVYSENVAREKRGGFKANADVWAINSVLRQDLVERVKNTWTKETGLDHTWFPYSEDAVARAYFRFRKRKDEEITAFGEELQAYKENKHAG